MSKQGHWFGSAGIWGAARIQTLVLAILLGSAGISLAITAEQKANWLALSGTEEMGAGGKMGLQYDVTTSTVVLTLEKGSQDIRATQDVIYHLRDCKKSAAFRAMGGDYTIEDYSCSDGEGHEFETYIDGEGGGSKTLVWFFPEMTKGYQRSLAKFTLKDDLKQSGDLNHVSAPWSAAWRTDVHCLRWTVILPEGVDPDVKSVIPLEYPAKKVFRKGRWTVTQDVAPLEGSAFDLAYVARDMGVPAPAEGTTVAIAMPEPCILSGKVVDLTTGKPAAGVHMYRVASMGGGDSSDYKEVTSDEDGNFKTKVSPGSKVSFQWQSSPDGKYLIDQEWRNQDPGNYQPLSNKVISKSESDVVLKVKLRPVASLKGLALDGQERPVAGAQVHVSSEAGPVTADTEGRFVLPIAPADRDYDVFVTSARKDLAGIAHLKKGTATTTIVLEPTRNYTGEVKSEDGLPAAKLSFTLYPKLNDSSLYRVSQQALTDATGKFTVENLCPQAPYSASWSSDNEQNRAYDYGSAEVDLTKMEEGQPIRFQAKMYVNALMGRVVDENGKPVSGAKIEPGGAGGMGSDLVRQDDRQNPKPKVSAKDGSFTIERLASGEIPMRISAPGHKPKTFKARTDDVDFTAVLPPPKAGGLTFGVTVKDEQGQPVASAPVELRTQVYDSSKVTTKVTTGSVVLKTDAAGKAKFSFAGLQEKQQGRGNIVCDRPGYNLAFCSVGPLDDDLEEEIALQKEGQPWRGRLVDSQSKPIAQAKVRVPMLQSPDSGGGYMQFGMAEMPTATSDAEGRFEFKRLGTKVSASLQIQADGYAADSANFDGKRDADKEKEFVLQAAGTIRGKIVAEGGAPATGKWTVVAQSPRGTAGSTTADPDGTFRIQGVKEGSYTVMASASSTETLRWVCPSPAAVDVVVGQAATVEIQVRPGIEVKGKIARPKGAAAAEDKVRFIYASPADDNNTGFSSGSRPASVGSDDKWTLYLPEGTFGLGYYIDGKGPITTGQKITVSQAKPLEEVVVELK
jgi:uncharacterized GH25 family protein